MRPLFVRKVLKAAGHSLSQICSNGVSPIAFNLSYNALYPLTNSFYDLFLMGCAMITFGSRTYATMIYWFFLLDFTGNLTVWSVDISPVTLRVPNVTMLVRADGCFELSAVIFW